ncbi:MULTISPECIES: universal stress protein [unclassified Algibacter]|uniref:universal stress protein n=1 Tax=unclassified Algibacter TaxID=2615009 RepID=UPI00131A7023|nr:MULTISPECIES: universal stress protein [unclassified Algibacter]MCL5127043.1 universal stress protein [Algibacter sp. L4_22]
MKNKKFKILVLSDLKKHTNSTITSAVSLSKMIDAEVDLFHVKKPTDVIGTDSQLSAIRALNHEQNQSRNKIKETINPLSQTYGVNITSNLSIGNVKSEIEAYIKATKPDIIVLGKRNSKVIKLVGDNITDFVLKTYEGPVMIVSNKNWISPETDLHIGLLNGKSQDFNQAFTEDLLAKTSKPLKSFNIVDSSNKAEENIDSSINKGVDYVFEKNDNTIKNLANYLEKSHVNLLFINRADNTDASANNKAEVKGVINSVNVSLFITGSTQKLAV